MLIYKLQLYIHYLEYAVGEMTVDECRI